MAKQMPYWEQLRHPNWQRRRLEIMKRDDFMCQCCKDRESTLNVHHKHYIKGRLAWEYSDDELVTLCELCHESQHDDGDRWKHLLAKLALDGPFSTGEAYALVLGFAHLNCGHDLTSEYEAGPLMFETGRIAAALNQLDIETLMEFADAAQSVGPFMLTEALSEFSKKLRDA